MASLLPNGFSLDHTKLNRIYLGMSGKTNDPFLSECRTTKGSHIKKYQKVISNFVGPVRGPNWTVQLDPCFERQIQNLNSIMSKIRYVNLCMMSLKLADSQEDISSE